MVHDVEGVEVCWAFCYHHSVRSRDLGVINRQFASAAEREAGEKLTLRDRREYSQLNAKPFTSIYSTADGFSSKRDELAPQNAAAAAMVLRASLRRPKVQSL